MLYIGEINYLNCTPLFSVLKSRFQDRSYQFVPGTPAELNAKLSSGAIDLCPSSSIEYALHPSSYLILPNMSISSIGRVQSVLLFSKVPIEQLDRATIALTGESATSVALLKILLAKRYAFTNTFKVVDELPQDCFSGCEALLLIGDSALRKTTNAGSCHIYDLGELWHDFTGCPFVFALWLLREDVLNSSMSDVVLLVERLLESKNVAGQQLAEIAASLAENDWTNRDFLINYWHLISYDLTMQHLDGLQLFFRYAAELAIISQAPALRFFKGSDV